MQLSTRTADYIVDTLELRSDMSILNEAFTDPHIVKVCGISSCNISFVNISWWELWFWYWKQNGLKIMNNVEMYGIKGDL